MLHVKWKSAVTAAALASLLACSPGTALAQTVGESGVANTPAINKTWTVGANGDFNNTEAFTFNVSYVKTIPQGSIEPTDMSKFGTKSVNLTAKWLDLAKGGVSSSAQMTASTLFGDTNFDKPGTYVFKLTEKAGENASISYSTATYYVYVQVAWKDGSTTTAEIESITFRGNADGTGDKVTPDFNNTPAASEGGKLDVSKTVSGKGADPEQEFSYTLKLDGKSAEGVSFTKTDANGGVTNGTVAAADVDKDGAYTFKLKHNERIEFSGIAAGTKYTVTEADTDYDESNTVNGTASQDGHVATGTLDKTADVAFKNTKGAEADTGIGSTALPLACVGVVAVAGALALVVSRRRGQEGEF